MKVIIAGSKKLGVSLATHNNPVLLRNAYAQLLLQNRWPDVVAVYINGDAGDYKYIIDELVSEALRRDLRTIFKYDGFSVPHPLPHQVPLRMLLDADVDLYTKLDHDDLIDTKHLGNLEDLMDDETDFAGNMLSNVLEVVPGKPVRYTPAMNWVWNPTQCASDCTMFNKTAAIAFYRAMIQSPNVPDDVAIASVLPSLRVKLVKQAPTLTYVSHGYNTSGPIATNDLYIEQLKEKQ